MSNTAPYLGSEVTQADAGLAVVRIEQDSFMRAHSVSIDLVEVCADASLDLIGWRQNVKPGELAREITEPSSTLNQRREQFVEIIANHYSVEPDVVSHVMKSCETKIIADINRYKNEAERAYDDPSKQGQLKYNRIKSQLNYLGITIPEYKVKPLQEIKVSTIDRYVVEERLVSKLGKGVTTLVISGVIASSVVGTAAAAEAPADGASGGANTGTSVSQTIDTVTQNDVTPNNSGVAVDTSANTLGKTIDLPFTVTTGQASQSPTDLPSLQKPGAKMSPSKLQTDSPSSNGDANGQASPGGDTTLVPSISLPDATASPDANPSASSSASPDTSGASASASDSALPSNDMPTPEASPSASGSASPDVSATGTPTDPNAQTQTSPDAKQSADPGQKPGAQTDPNADPSAQPSQAGPGATLDIPPNADVKADPYANLTGTVKDYLVVVNNTFAQLTSPDSTASLDAQTAISDIKVKLDTVVSGDPQAVDQIVQWGDQQVVAGNLNPGDIFTVLQSMYNDQLNLFPDSWSRQQRIAFADSMVAYVHLQKSMPDVIKGVDTKDSLVNQLINSPNTNTQGSDNAGNVSGSQVDLSGVVKDTTDLVNSIITTGDLGPLGLSQDPNHITTGKKLNSTARAPFAAVLTKIQAIANNDPATIDAFTQAFSGNTTGAAQALDQDTMAKAYQFMAQLNLSGDNTNWSSDQKLAFMYQFIQLAKLGNQARANLVAQVQQQAAAAINTPPASPEINNPNTITGGLIDKIAQANNWPAGKITMAKTLLVDLHVPLAAAAGMMGNASVESTHNYDSGIQEFGTGIGFGYFQWSFGRRDALEAAAQQQGVDPADPVFQIKFAINESKHRSQRNNPNANEWAGFVAIKDPKTAAEYWQWNFERPNVQPGQSQRTDEAQSIFNQITFVLKQEAAAAKSPNTKKYNTYPSTIDGMPYSNQKDPTVANYPYNRPDGSKTNIGYAGCGPNTQAMVARFFGLPNASPISQADINEKMGFRLIDGTDSARSFKYLADTGGLTFNDLSKMSPSEQIVAIKGILNNPNKQALVVLAGQDQNPATPFTSGGHIIEAYDISNAGSLKILDGNGRFGLQNSGKWWAKSQLLDKASYVYLIYRDK